jgi:nucleoside-diphosphate-sugar epimerase
VSRPAGPADRKPGWKRRAVRERRRVLVTHADQPLGRRIVKLLFHDDEVESILGVGDGPPPRAFDRFLASADGRLRYARTDLARHRSVAELFHSATVRSGAVDSVIHVPAHGPSNAPETSEGRARKTVAGVSTRTAEARLVLQQCLQTRSVRHLVVLGSAAIYRLAPGNANRLTEDSELDLDPDAPAELRSWVDCDMIFHGEINNDNLRVVLLRVPTIVATGGAVFFNPSLSPVERGAWGPDLRPMGFDPLCALISDQDVAGAVRLALHGRSAGVYNIAGTEALPLSVLSRWMGHWSVGVPGPLLRATSRVAGVLSGGWLRVSLDAPQLRYGFTLDTTRAERELAFRPSYRIGLARAGDGKLRIETAHI